MGKAIDQREFVDYSLFDYLPYLNIEQNKIFFDDLSSVVGFNLNPVYDEIMSNEHLIENKKSLMNFLNGLEEDVYCQYIFKKTKNLEDIKDNHLEINQSDNKAVKESFKRRLNKIEDDINKNKLFNFEHYLFMKKKFNTGIKNPANILYSDKKMNNKTKEKIENIFKNMSELADEYKNHLENAKLLSDQELADIIIKQINLSKEDIEYKRKEDLLHSDLEINKDYIYTNGKYARTISFKAGREPEEVYPGIINYLLGFKEKKSLQLNFEYDVILNFKMLNKEEQKNKFERQKALTQSKKYRPKFLGGGVKKEVEQQERHLDNLLEDITSGQENIFKVEPIVIIKADNQEELNNYTDQMISNIRQMEGAEGYKESFANFNLYLNTLPGNVELNNHRNFKFRTSYFADLLPVFGPPKGTGEPLMLFRNKYNSITYFNPINKNYLKKNAIVIGSTGSGKSFNMNMINLNLMGFDPQITIIDKGGSYKKFIETFGGENFEISFDENGNPNYQINPFDVEITKDKDLYWRSIIEVMIKEKASEISNDDRIIIEESIAYIKEKGIEIPTISDFVNAIKNIDFADAGKLETIRAKVERHLNRWTRGRYGELFDNKKGNLDISNDIVGLDLEGLENYEEILEVFMFYLSTICRAKVEQSRKRVKQFVFDEVWQLMLSDQGGELISELYRTIRKKGGSVYSISQSISDFADSKHAPAILENISMFYVLKQSDGTNFNKLKNTLNLNNEIIEQIKQIRSIKGEFSEMFIKTPNQKFMGRMTPCSYEYWLATTDSKDIVLFNEVLENMNGNLNKTLDYLAKNYPKGA